jgi:integrase
MASLKIDPRSRNWYACVTLPDGRQTQLSTKLRHKEVSREKAQIYADTLEKAYRTKRAEAQFRKLMSDAWVAISGTPLPSSTPESFFAAWLARRKNEVDHSSFLRYSGIVRDFLAFLGERKDDDLSSISSGDILHFRDHQAARMSATSANLSVKILRIALKGAIRERLITENPAAKEFIDPIKRKNENQRRRAFTIPELQKLLAQAEATEWKGLILAGIYLGQRLADIVRLSWANIDLTHSEISIVTEKTGRTQLIPIAPTLGRYIIEELPTPEHPAAPLFPRAFENVQRLGRVGSLSRQFHQLLINAGLVPPEECKPSNGDADKTTRSKRRTVHPLSYHSLRHTTTSLLKNAGVNNAVAMDVIGHTSVSISTHYTTIDTETKRRAIALLPDVLSRSPSGDEKP